MSWINRDTKRSYDRGAAFWPAQDSGKKKKKGKRGVPMQPPHRRGVYVCMYYTIDTCVCAARVSTARSGLLFRGERRRTCSSRGTSATTKRKIATKLAAAPGDGEVNSTRARRQPVDRRDVLLGRALLFLPPSVRTCSDPGRTAIPGSVPARIGAKRRRRGGGNAQPRNACSSARCRRTDELSVDVR